MGKGGNMPFLWAIWITLNTWPVKHRSGLDDELDERWRANSVDRLVLDRLEDAL